MFGNDFIYCFQNSLNQFYGLDENNQLRIDTNPYLIKYNPDGWDNIAIKNQRNKKYFGLDRQVSVPLSFVEDGAEILKNVFYRYGYEADIKLSILERRLAIDGTEYWFWYKVIFSGEVDLSTYVHEDYKVTVNTLEEGMVKYLKSNDNVTFEYPLNVPEAVKVKNDGIDLLQKAGYFVSNGALPDDLGGHTIDITLNASEQVQTLGANSQDRVKTGNSSQSLWDVGEFFMITGAVPQSFTFTWDFKLTPVLASGVGAVFGTSIFLQLKVIRDRDYLDSYNIDAKGGGDPIALYNVEQHFQGSYTITIPENRRLVLYLSANFNRDLTFFNYNLDGGSFSIDYKYRYTQTITRCLRPSYVFSKLVESMTEGKFKADISGLLTEQDDKVFTSGMEIRQDDNPVLKISFSNFFGFFDTYKDCGLFLTPEKKIKLERKSLMVNKDNYVDIGEISELVVSVAKDFLCNVIKIGYPDKQQEDLNGLESFNNTFEWTIGSVRNPAEFNKVCNVISDCYSSEITRIRFIEKPTTDSKQDNDVYVYHIEDTPDVDGNYAFDRSINSTAIGLIEKNSVFNIELSPKRCLLNNGPYLRGCLDLLDTRYITFTTSSKNNKLESGSPLIREKDRVQVSNLGEKYFKPYFFDFKTSGLDNLLDILDLNPLQVIRFSHKGIYYKGIPDSVGTEPSTRKSQQYRLLCTSDTDLKPLIDFYV